MWLQPQIGYLAISWTKNIYLSSIVQLKFKPYLFIYYCPSDRAKQLQPVFMCTCLLYACMYVYMSRLLHVCMCVYMSADGTKHGREFSTVQVYIYVYVYIHIYIYIYMYIYIYVYIYMYMYLCICVAIKRSDNPPTNKICRSRVPWATHDQHWIVIELVGGDRTCSWAARGARLRQILFVGVSSLRFIACVYMYTYICIYVYMYIYIYIYVYIEFWIVDRV